MFTYRFFHEGSGQIRLKLNFFGEGGVVGDYRAQRVKSALIIMQNYNLIGSGFIDSLSKSYRNDQAEDLLNCFEEFANKGFVNIADARNFLEPIIALVNSNRNGNEL